MTKLQHLNEKKVQKLDYPKLMDKLLSLPVYTLVATGRHGTDFVQSLLDSHPDVLTFNGYIHLHEFWHNSKCVASESFELEDILNEFIGLNIEKFRSKYDLVERMDQLGENGDQAIDIDLNQFKCDVINLLQDQAITSKTFFVAVYAAYSMCLGQDVGSKKIIFHHEHSFDYIRTYMQDFPNTKFLVMTRDPRASFVSGIQHFRNYDPTKDNEVHLYLYTRRLFAGADWVKNFNNEYAVLRIEDLDSDEILKKFAKWLGVSYESSMRESTWGGLLWHGDRVTVNKIKDQGMSRDILKNKWEEKLSFLDQYIFNVILNPILQYYGYKHDKLTWVNYLLAPLFILLPLRDEWRFLSISYVIDRVKRREFGAIAKNFYYYFFRLGLFFKYYIKSLKNEELAHPLISFDEEKSES